MTEFWTTLRQQWKKLWKEFLFSCCLPSLGCYIFVELCSRKSVLNLGMFFLQNPLVFFYNVLIIAATASVCLLFRRKIFVLSVVLLLWGIVGVTDAVVLSFRTTPFTAVDLVLLKDALKIVKHYLSWFGIVLLCLGAVALIVLCVYLFCKAKKEEQRIEYQIRIPFCIAVFGVCLLLTDIGMTTGLLERSFGNLAQAFHDNGLPYCFMNSVLNSGIKRPEAYSQETMGDLLEKFQEEAGKELVTGVPKPTEAPDAGPEFTPTIVPEATNAPEKESESKIEKEPDEMVSEYPNIIFLQLESFFDVKYIRNASYTEDPIPFFTALKENYPSGFLEVPSIGAGTANTEFECLTGMNMDFFGPGDYPYRMILRERTCESLAYILKERGYSATAMHNNDGTFYGRNEVFSNLGFDRYISLEYMAGAEMNPLGWVKDEILTDQIMEVLDKTEESDFIYAISVQGHGAYPEESLLSETKFGMELPEELENYREAYLYYIHQLNEMDQFLKELVISLSACREEVVLVVYGDHLPSLGLSEDILENGTVFQTEYVVWSNRERMAEDKDIEAYQLTSRVLELLGINEGIMPQFHTYRQDDEDYLEHMELLMYDMLYGEMEIYGGKTPYEPTELQMGLEEICIEDVYLKESPVPGDRTVLYLYGQHFTEWSKVAINGETMDTLYLNEELLVALEFPKNDDGVYRITVRQQGEDELVLSETKVFEYHLTK